LAHVIPARFLERLTVFPEGYSDGTCMGRRYGTSVSRGLRGATKLYGEELGGQNRISFNLYLPDPQRAILKPCEMSVEKVIDFVVSVKLTEPLPQTDTVRQVKSASDS
jgi:hypothetical protein